MNFKRIVTSILQTYGIFIFVMQSGLSLYSSGSGVIDLTPSNFQKEVIGSDEVWVVEFYAPWCGHCQSLVPEYKKVAKALKGVVKVGAVNVDEHNSLGGQYGIQGFPTIKTFGNNKLKPEDYKGPRNSQGLVDAVMKIVKEKVNLQSGKKAGSGSESGSDGDVIELTNSNFDKLVLQSDDQWLVEFFAPWCGHCQRLAPEWKKAASKLKGKFKLGALDATEHQSKAGQYGIKGYPTIKYFHKGKVEDYDGGRTANDIVQWAEGKVVVHVDPPKIHQLVDQSVLDEACSKHPLCIISILPHILDCESECRNKYIKDILSLGDKYKEKMWGYVWAEAMTYPALEEALDIGGFGYPAMAAVNTKKMQFALFRGSFSYDGINEFLRDISFGRGRTAPVKGAKIPKISKTEPWDGKDGVLPLGEDIDPSDIDFSDDLFDKIEL